MTGMQLLNKIVDNAPAVGVSLLIGILAAALTFGAMFALTAKLAAGLDFLGFVGLPLAGIVSIGAFIVTFRRIRAN
jgi:hypothetical protein